MKKLVVLLAVVCCASMAFATNYNPLTDWVVAPGAPAAWQFGARLETAYGTGVFGALVPDTHLASTWGPIPDSDGWADTTSSGNTCSIWWKDPWQAGPGPVMNAWDNHQATARVTPQAATYNLAVSWIGTGYAAPATQTTNVYVVMNGSTILWQAQIHGANAYTVPVGTTLSNLTFAAGDYLDFISANANDAGESRTKLTANLTLVPEPATMILLGLGGLLLRKRK